MKTARHAIDAAETLRTACAYALTLANAAIWVHVAAILARGAS